MEVSLLDPQSSAWLAETERLYAELGGVHNPSLFPYHFIQAVLPRIGGQIATVRQGDDDAVVFLFPFAQHSAQKEYTGRFHALKDGTDWHWDAVQTSLENALQDTRIRWYHPDHPQRYEPTHQWLGDIDIGRPDQHEAEQIRSLQQQIWVSPPEFLYPIDIHSADFALGTSLVARVGNEIAGFLFGFTKFGGYPLPADWQTRFQANVRLESQTLGVLPQHRGLRLGFLLKQVQAQAARTQGIDIINWTVDPLQYPNASLNFGLLRAVAFDFTADYYPFRNALNRVAASRFSLTWLVNCARVQQASLLGVQATVVDLRHRPAILRLNEQWNQVADADNAPFIAIEIPRDWTTLQRENLEEAIRWRTVTDEIFSRTIGRNPGQYVVTDVGVDGERRFLIAEQAGDALWESLGAA